MPRSIKNIPPIIDTHFKYLVIFSTYIVAFEKTRAIKMKGIANPAENTVRSKAPCNTVVVVDAKRSIEPRIGPTQGVQPNANAAPIASELDGLPIFRNDGIFILLSTLRKGMRNTPSIKSPNRITSAPPARVSHILYGVSPCPTKPASVPKTIKTIAKPIMKVIPFTKIFLRAYFALSGSFKSSADTPLIKPKYAGTSGSVQGARNVISPATNADMIKPMSIA